MPLPSSSGAFSYAWDSDVDTFVRFEQSLGAGFGERAQTLGKGRFNVGLSYQHVDFSTLAGDSLDNIVLGPAGVQQGLPGHPAGATRPSSATTSSTPSSDMSFTFDLFYLSAAYGLTDTIDVSLALAINHAHMQGNATAMTLDPDGNGGGIIDGVAQFSADQPGADPERNRRDLRPAASAAPRPASTSRPPAPATSFCAPSGTWSTPGSPTSPSPRC